MDIAITVHLLWLHINFNCHKLQHERLEQHESCSTGDAVLDKDIRFFRQKPNNIPIMFSPTAFHCKICFAKYLIKTKREEQELRRATTFIKI